MPVRTYTYDFYQAFYASSSPDAAARTLGDRLVEIKEIKDGGNFYYKDMGSFTYEIRELFETDYGFKGVVGKHRHIDLPPAAYVGGDEREIELREGENILEKTQFLFYSDMNLLVLRRNIMCIGHAKLAKLFAEARYACSLNPVINPADVSLLARGNMKLKHMDIAIARPTNPELFRGLEHDFNNTLFQSMQQTGAARFNAEFRGDGRSRIPDSRYLDSAMKRALREMTATFDVEKCNIMLEDEDTGISHPVDLVADRIVSRKQVDSPGSTVRNSDVFSSMEEAKDEEQPRLDEYFGRGDDVIR